MTDLGTPDLPDFLPHALEPVGAVTSVCEWTPAEDAYDFGYDASCGQAWSWFNEDPAGQRPWNYCANCGKPVRVLEASSD